MRTAVPTSAAICLALAAFPAAAQPSGQQTAQGNFTADIIVTALRRPESLQKVPVSVNVVTADTLSDRTINSIRQLDLAAPRLQLGQDSMFAVREVGTLAVQQTANRAVTIAIDKVNLARAPLNEGIFNDIAQIEILDGPQGLLFGTNATAGLLNITTGKPVRRARTLRWA